MMKSVDRCVHLPGSHHEIPTANDPQSRKLGERVLFCGGFGLKPVSSAFANYVRGSTMKVKNKGVRS